MENHYYIEIDVKFQIIYHKHNPIQKKTML